jgi:hypothetical protein
MKITTEVKEPFDRIDETPTVLELTKALARKGYTLLELDRLFPAVDHVFMIKVQDTKPKNRRLGTSKNPVHQVF